MPSLATVYRAIVMVAAGVIVVKGWQHYGPTPEQVKTIGGRAVELAEIAWNKVQPNAAEPAASDDPRLAVAAPPAAQPAATNPPAAIIPATAIEPAPLLAAPSGNLETVATGGDASSPAQQTADRLPALYSRLKELGATDLTLSPWGSGGQLYRFHCRAALGDSPQFARHFEAVASEPRAAVAWTVAKVEAWRATQHDSAAELR
jgi:hypothetical protein